MTNARFEHHEGKVVVVVDMTGVNRELADIKSMLRQVIGKEGQIMGKQDDIDASVAAVGTMVTDLRDSVVPGIAGAQTKLDQVIADLNAQGVDTSALASITADLADAKGSLDSTVANLVADPNIPTPPAV